MGSFEVNLVLPIRAFTEVIDALKYCFLGCNFFNYTTPHTSFYRIIDNIAR